MESKRISFIGVLMRIGKLNANLLPLFSFSILLLIASQLLAAVMNYIMGEMLDYIGNMEFDKFYYAVFCIIILQILKTVVQYLATIKVGKLSEQCVRKMRLYTYEHVTKASMDWLDRNRIGDIISRVNGDLNSLVEALNNLFQNQVTSLFTIVVSIIACIYINPKLSFYGFLIVPVVLIIQMLLGKPIAKLSQESAKSNGKLNSYFADLLGGLTISKIFSSEWYMSEKYKQEVERNTQVNIHSFNIEFALLGLQLLMQIMPIVLIYSLGTYYVLNSDMTFGKLFSFAFIATMAINAIGTLANQIRNIYNTVGLASRIFEIWDVKEEEEGGTVTKVMPGTSVCMENVSFSYGDDANVLNNINLEILAGERVALVGTSGSGKSTLMKLIMGFYKRSGGSLRLFGSDIDEWEKKELRKYISYVGQDSFLFNGTIMSNVLMGNPDASEEDALRVIKDVNLDRLNVYEDIGEFGTKLSGGQRQRVCIARALLKDAPLVLLDEPTSALDTESEYYVSQAIEFLCKNKTTIMISHRFSALRNVDRIICMQNGIVVEEGTHDELLKRGNVYKRLYDAKRGKD